MWRAMFNSDSFVYSQACTAHLCLWHETFVIGGRDKKRDHYTHSCSDKKGTAEIWFLKGDARNTRSVDVFRWRVQRATEDRRTRCAKHIVCTTDRESFASPGASPHIFRGCWPYSWGRSKPCRDAQCIGTSTCLLSCFHVHSWFHWLLRPNLAPKQKQKRCLDIWSIWSSFTISEWENNWNVWESWEQTTKSESVRWTSLRSLFRYMIWQKNLAHPPL